MTAMKGIHVIMEQGAMGANEFDSQLDRAIRALAVTVGNPKDWNDKYGADFENEIFMMHRYCWCEKDDCPWCKGTNPNFLYKPTGFKVWWYKYIGRGMRIEGEVSDDMFSNCLNSVHAPEQMEIPE